VSGQRVGVERQLELGGTEHEQLGPGVLDQQRLVDERQRYERRQVFDPLDRHEEKARGRLADQLGAVGRSTWQRR